MRDVGFSQATATLYTIAQIADVGNQLLRQSGGVAEAAARRRLGASIGMAESNFIVNGTGSGQPLGILPALLAFGDRAQSERPMDHAERDTRHFGSRRLGHRPGGGCGQRPAHDYPLGPKSPVDDGQPAMSGQIGLDGRYRFGSGREGLPSGFRGSWAGPTTFAVDFDEIANNHAYDLRFEFGEDRLTLVAQDRTEDAGFTVAALRERG